MTTLYHTWETGQASGTAVTAGNSGTGGTAVSSVTATNSATVAYDDQAPRGALCLLCVTTSTAGQAFASWGSAVVTPAMSRAYARATVRPDVIPSQTSVMRLRSGATQTCRVSISASLRLELRNSGNTVVATSAGTMTAGVPWRWALDITVGSSSVATLYIYYDPTSPTPDEMIPVSAVNFGTGNIDDCAWGIVASVASAGLRIDDAVITDVGLPGPPAQSISLAETLTIADTVGRLYAGVRDVGEALTLTDGVARQYAAVRDVVEALALVDTVGRQYTGVREVAETLSLVDQVSRQLAAVRSAGDALTLADTVGRQYAGVRGVAESLALADALAAVLSLIGPIGDIRISSASPGAGISVITYPATL